MKIGVITDTHDDVDRVDRAARLFKDRGVNIVIHCGDFCTPFIPKRFKGLKVIGILGNTDGDPLALSSALAAIGGELRGRFASLELDQKRIAVTHGEYSDLIKALGQSGLYDIVLFGHSHERYKEKIGQTWILNPGVESVLLYDTKSGDFEFVLVEGTNSVKIRAKYAL